MTAPPDPSWVQQRLRDRARALARPIESAHPVETIELLEFGLAEERYALEAAKVHDVQPLRELTPLPGTPAFLAGVVHVHGRLVAVVDIKRFLGLPQRGLADLHCIVLLKSADMEVGLLADSVAGVHHVPREALQLPSTEGTGIGPQYLQGITAERLVLLDATAILSDQRLVINEEVELQFDMREQQ